jgi:hypothetical protein
MNCDEDDCSFEDIGVFGLFDAKSGALLVAVVDRRAVAERRSVVDEDEID